jgi:hypothetical protein
MYNKPKKLNLEKKVRLQAPLYYIKKEIIKKSFNIPD